MNELQIPQKNRNEVVNDILESIALEESAIAVVIKAEGKKIQKVLECDFPCPETFNQVLAFQKSVTEVLGKLVQKQQVILAKMKLLRTFAYDCEDECNPICDDEE